MTSSRRGSLFRGREELSQESINNHYKKLVNLYNTQNKRRATFNTLSFPSKVSWGEVEQEEGRRLYEEGGTSMTRLLMELLDISGEDTVVDVGAGNCRTGHQMTQLCHFTKPVLCVDPVQELLFLASEFDHIRILQATALQFSKMEEIRYNKIYMKSVIHHVGRDKLPQLFAGLYNQLEPRGRLLIDTGSDTCSLPWPPRAVAEYNRLHGGLTNCLINALKKAGFNIHTHHLAMEAHVNKMELFSSFRQRCSSMFEFLSDAEMEEGIKDLDGKWKENSIRYIHGRILLLGTKLN